MPLLEQVKDIEKGFIGITESGEEVLLSNPSPMAEWGHSIHELEEQARKKRDYYQIGGCYKIISSRLEIIPYILWTKKE